VELSASLCPRLWGHAGMQSDFKSSTALWPTREKGDSKGD
jgi:hypothetical protein